MKSILFTFAFPILMAGVWICERNQPIEAVRLSENDLALLRSNVREIIRPKCGSCHTSGLPTAKAKALAVFDLKSDIWSTGMNEQQLRNFSNRLSDVQDSAKVKVAALLSAELEKR